MRLKTLIDEDFINYKKASMFIGTISCSGKCCVEANISLDVCQNREWIKLPTIEVSDDEICNRYIDNKLTSAIVIGGLEPFEQFEELKNFIKTLREKYECDDDIVIYSGYTSEELKDMILELKKYKNIIIKFGRFIPNSTPRYDTVLGITLISDNQYGEKIS